MVAKRQSVQIILSEEEKDILDKACNILVEFQYVTDAEDQNAVDKLIDDYCGCADGVDTAIDILHYLVAYSIKKT